MIAMLSRDFNERLLREIVSDCEMCSIGSKLSDSLQVRLWPGWTKKVRSLRDFAIFVTWLGGFLRKFPNRKFDEMARSDDSRVNPRIVNASILNVLIVLTH
jgi:hypothetical protein